MSVQRSRIFVCGPSGEGPQCSWVSYFDSMELGELARRKKRIPDTHNHIEGGDRTPAWGPASECVRR